MVGSSKRGFCIAQIRVCTGDSGTTSSHIRSRRLGLISRLLDAKPEFILSKLCNGLLGFNPLIKIDKDFRHFPTDLWDYGHRADGIDGTCDGNHFTQIPPVDGSSPVGGTG